jgi:hypothetical protein
VEEVVESSVDVVDELESVSVVLELDWVLSVRIVDVSLTDVIGTV